ncbi:hypothetical protein pb186bvf_001692 [Paramecium bursaria]
MHRTWRITLQDLKETNNLRLYFHSAAEHDIQKQLKDAPLQLPYNFHTVEKVHINMVGIGDLESQLLEYGKISISNLLIMGDQIIFMLELQILKEISKLMLILIYWRLMSIQSRLWWPKGQGDQNLYQVTCQLIYKDNILQQKQIKTGIKIAKWILQDDSNGQTFKLNLNNRDIYIKGANYIPPDMFMPRALKNPQVYVDIFLNSLAAGYNGLRIWGGGQFEYDIFYELADQHGILLWHDFLFACAMYPGTNDYLENIRQEIYDNVKRIRIHPSIIMWNGNNEVELGWKTWGWASLNQGVNQQLIASWYTKIFREVIPNVLKEINPDIFYWETSPSPNWLSRGDIHYWGVWASRSPIESYQQSVGRFNSEYGMQALIDVNNVKKFIKNPNDVHLNSLAFQIHQRHIVGIPTIQYYLNEYTGESTDFSRNIYFSQLVQFIALETAIGSLRNSKPYNMGTFYWQINDVWPVVSWATVDYYNCWKGGHYAAKKSHQDPAMFANKIDNNPLKVYIVNDQEKVYQGNITIQWITTANYIIKSWRFENFEIGNQAKLVVNESLDDFEQFKNQSYVFMRFDCYQQDCDFYGTQIFTRPKSLKLQDPQIQYTKYNNILTFTSQALAKSVYITGESECINLDKNFFDIVPNNPIKIKLPSDQKLRIMSLYQ